MKLFSSFFLIFVFCSTITVSESSADTLIRCASTTSTQNSGLFEYLMPIVERATGVRVNVIAVGTGAALRIGERGDVDVVLVHAKEEELLLVKEGYFVNRHDLMYNDFVIVGPPDDPAGIKIMKSAAEAFKAISDKSALFVSRGDDSGTYKKELKIWEKAGINPHGRKWRLEVGQGMGKTLRIADEKRAYTLTDRGTWLALRDRDKLQMLIMVEKDPMLFNQYGVMAVNPQKHKHVNYSEAIQFITFLISEEGQKAISLFKDARGNQLFYPNAQ